MKAVYLSINQTLKNARQQLVSQQDTAHLDAEVLLAYVLNQSRTYLHTWPEKIITQQEFEQYQQLIHRRVLGEPIAYITGRREFWSMELQVNESTLIPRPETELLVELALEKIPLNCHWHIADLGTGTGAIALAVARERPSCHITAVDLSPHAIDVAEKNAQDFCIDNISFREGNWADPLHGELYDIILSNPPYIAEGDPYLNRGDLRYEPETALCSGADGLDAIRQIIADSRKILKSGGWILIEHGFNQQQAVQTLLKEFGYGEVRGYHDLADHPRIVAGKYNT